MGLEDDPTRGKYLVWIPCTSLNKDGLISHWSKLHPSPEVFFRTLETRCPNPCITSFIELDDGKIDRKTLYFMVKTMVSCKFSLKPIQWQLGSHRDLIPTGTPSLTVVPSPRPSPCHFRCSAPRLPGLDLGSHHFGGWKITSQHRWAGFLV